MRTGAERYLLSRLEDPEYKQAYDAIRTQLTKSPKNTSKQDPMEHFAAAVFLGSSNAIEHQEAAGQIELVNSEVLPVDLGYGAGKEAYEALGFIFGEVVKDDPIFQAVTLPDGWSRKASSHSMWSHIVDERGIERVGVFYKAAYYDRSAHMSITNVGGNLASSFVYGEASLTDENKRSDDMTFDETWPILTDHEKLAFVQYLHGWIDKWRNHPDIYGRDTNVAMIRGKYESLGLRYLGMIGALTSYMRW